MSNNFKIKTKNISDLEKIIHDFIILNNNDLVYLNTKNYHNYKSKLNKNRSAVNIEFKENKLKITIYCNKYKIKKLENEFKDLNISLESYIENPKGKGNLRLRPIISTINEFEIIKPYIIEGINNYYNEIIYRTKIK